MSTVAILKNLRSLVGDEAFNAAVAELSGSSGGAGEVSAKKARKQSAVDPEKSAKKKADMGALQNFIKTQRMKHPDGTPYKEVQKAAGELWKTMDAAARDVYKVVETEDRAVTVVESAAKSPKPVKVVAAKKA